MSRIEIFTTGFPRSGNTWLNRLLSDLLSSPMQTKPNEEIEYFGAKRNGIYVVRKTHWYATEYNGKGYGGEKSKMIWIQRDPRDMAVSIMFYRVAQPNLMGVLKSICTNGDPQPKVPVVGYRGFMESWLSANTFDYMTRYELLHSDPVRELSNIYKAATGEKCSINWAINVNDRQKFSKHSAKYHHSMRKGKTGDYKNYFKRKHGKYMTEMIGDIMLDQGYIDDLDWWKELPE